MRPTIALACIMKNEAHNLAPLLQSVKGCFDEIVLVDTGSTDGTLEFVEKINGHIRDGSPDWAGLPEIKLEHFAWVSDFAAARQYSFDKCASDYVCWMDLDDALSSAEAFIQWRDTVLHTAHYWVATYNYAFSPSGQVECQFIRERVVKNNYGFKWRYFVHEGIVQAEPKKFWPNRVTTWTVNHRRTPADRDADQSRNLNLFEMRDYNSLEPRMLYYYGKELVENGKPVEAGRPLHEAMKSPLLEMHDRVLCMQYACQSAMAAKAYAQVIKMAHDALMLVPSRAEMWCLIGDANLAMGQHAHARLAFKNALQCQPDPMGGFTVVQLGAYSEYPRVQLASIAINSGDPDGSLEHIAALIAMRSPRADELERAASQVRSLTTVRTGLPRVDDIAIICPPQGAETDWDELSLKERGHGGSETAAIEVAKFLREKTGRRVLVFQPRKERTVMPSGVEYVPATEIQGYLQNVEPAAVINWRHPTKLSSAPTYIWCHDLVCPGAENVGAYDKIFALSGFHKDYLHQVQGIPFEKMELLFNGINPSDFESCSVQKMDHKIVFSSSPDRGLDRAIRIVEKAREISGLPLELHCFYGFKNMRLMGGEMAEMADRLEAMIKERSWVKYHGFVNKRSLMLHFQEASTWIYPANFIETYCITAIEALVAKCYPIVRDMGALKHTMHEAIEKGMCDVLDTDCETDAEVAVWAGKVVEAVLDKKYRKVHINAHDYSWEKVAERFIEVMRLQKGVKAA